MGVILSGSTTDDESIVFFDGTYEEAMKAARKQKKPMLLDFYADWCGPCKQMEKYSFSDPDLAKLINEDFIAFRVNVDWFWGMDIAEEYQIKKYPTLIFTTKKGKEIRRAVGFKSAKEIQEIASKVLSK